MVPAWSLAATVPTTLLMTGLLVSGLLIPAAHAQRSDEGPRDRFRVDGFRQRMLERLDSNGNGMVEPNEVPPPARRFFDRFAQEAGLSADQPIPVRGAGDSSRPSPGGAKSPSHADRPREAGRSTSDPLQSVDPYPRVPRFGNGDVPRFGVSPASLQGKVVDLEKRYDRRILDAVDRTLQRYDTNNTGMLEYDEWMNVQWRKDPRESDLDHDGQLTKAELAERYQRGESDEKSDTDSPRGGSRGGRSGNRFAESWDRDTPSRDLPDRAPREGGPQRRPWWPENGWATAEGAPDEFPGPDRGSPGGSRRQRDRGNFDPASRLAMLDQNGNGTIEPEEVDDRIKGFVERRFGFVLDRPVRIDEILRSMNPERDRDDRPGGRQDATENPDRPAEKKGTATPEPVTGYRIAGEEKHQGRKSYRARDASLPKLMPDWWKGRDVNRDGQVTLHEFMKNPNASTVNEFYTLDRNNDGFVTAQEAHLSVADTQN